MVLGASFSLYDREIVTNFRMSVNGRYSMSSTASPFIVKLAGTSGERREMARGRRANGRHERSLPV